jgi:hypothetical protein
LKIAAPHTSTGYSNSLSIQEESQKHKNPGLGKFCSSALMGNKPGGKIYIYIRSKQNKNPQNKTKGGAAT